MKRKHAGAADMARLRWRKTPKAKRRAHAVKMNDVRWAEHRKAKKAAP